MLEGALDVEIVDLRLFDFSLPKGGAKIEITFIEVNFALNFQGLTLDNEERRKEERIVLTPDQVKEIHIVLDGFTEIPINPLGFISSSGSFPLTQTWERPTKLKYPVEAE